MPLYEYECGRCKHRFELIQKFSDKKVRKCPECGGRVERLISAPAIRFKGTGWYVTDYGNKSRSEASSEKSEAMREAADSKSDTKSESKSDSKSETKSGAKKKNAA
jgi:putative FmdB family regulatory protein